MAAVTRQPFAPLDGARLQSLTSMKNRQNALSPASGGKRKASELADVDDFENIDPFMFSKRPKGVDSFGFPSKDSLKSPSIVLTKATKSFSAPSVTNVPTASPRRTLLQPKSPAAKLNIDLARSSTLSAPAGRSPTRGKKTGILSNRRRTAGSYTRVDPHFGASASVAPFSLDAALKGTIPSYTGRSASSARNEAFSTLDEPDMKASWFFDIHEDTPEQEMTNLLQHGTHVLDISSDEESEQKARRERAEGRDKENIPPADDVSQTSSRRSQRPGEDEMLVEKERSALAEMNATEYYAAGCDETSVVIVPGDEDHDAPEEGSPAASFEFAPAITPTMPLEPLDDIKDVEELMSKTDEPAAKAAVLEPMEGTGESFELWESGSAKDEAEAAPVSEC